ncbi:uncharacterized protein LOC121369226 [Gigantopelta aegis]|uniref:uncharacterized protein LOC121369226 n=1 Tax=Gigantopelta aegis TaxID=1735272 RepID=UPI001B88750C|nr:uncharacterized protein LOC121369226 [Gigantopelta aegis]
MKPSLGLVLITVLLAVLELAVTQTSDDDPCNDDNHTTIDQPARGVGSDPESNVNSQPFCDKNLAEGWYHFELNGVTAEIPTTCLRSGSCSGSISMRIDLGDRALPAVEGKEVHASVCGSYEVLGQWDCCVLRQTTRIRNCGKFYIYYLYPVDRCPVSYCVQDSGQSIPPELIVKQGDVVNNVSAETTSFTAITLCQDDQLECNVNNTVSCARRCDDVTECDDGVDEDGCDDQMTTPYEVFPAPPPDDDLSSAIPESSNTTSTTTDVLVTRSLYSVSTSPSDFTEQNDPTHPATDDGTTDDGSSVSIDSAFEEGAGATESETTERSLAESSSVIHKGKPTTEDHVSESSLVAELPVVSTGFVTDVPGVMTSIKENNSKAANTTTLTTPTTPASSSVNPLTKELATSSPVSSTEASTSSSSVEQTDGSAAVPSSPTSSLPTTSRDTVTKETHFSSSAGTSTMTSTVPTTTTSTVPPTTTIPKPSPQADDGRIVLKFRSGKNHIEDKKNFTAVMKSKLTNLTAILGSDTGLENGSGPSVVLTDGPTLKQDYVYLTFRLEQNNDVVPADVLLQLFRVLQTSDKNKQTWREMDLELVDFYKATDGPGTEVRPNSSLFKDNVVLFIAIISIGSLCIIIVVVWLCCIRCRNRSSSDRSSVLKANVSDNRTVLSVENPATDAEIMKDETNQLKETHKGDSHLPPGAPPEDENGWIVPLDEVTTDNVAFETEDTRF